jgi:CHAT domain-containing protein
MDAMIQSRGVVLDELAARAQSSVGADPELASLNAAVAATRERFANLMLRSIQGQESVPRTLLDETRQQKEDAERALAEKSFKSRADVARAHVGLDEVRRALPRGSALVSFVRYDRTSFTTNQDRTIAHVVPSYVAFVIPSTGGAISVIPLGSAALLESSVNAWRREVDGRSLAETAAGEAERAYRIAGARLRQRTWDPLADRLRGASYVFIVPDGALNLVSFPALPTEGNKYLVESGPVIHLLSTERDLVPAEATPIGHGLLAVGGPAYDLRLRSPVRAAVRGSDCGSSGPLRFDDLPGSRAEVQDIARIWSPAPVGGAANAAAIDGVTMLSGRAASKGAVTRASSGRRVVHLATHGFFLGSPCAPGPGNTRGVGGIATASSGAFAAADNPLLFAGLAFAGANRQAAARAGQDDGILTAEEVAALNLQGTEWAVLSACDTGLGEIRTGEGVFGLRRAFQIAGVRTIIMSLWSVEDQSTRSWMRALYEGRFQQHLSTADAVHRADVRLLQSRRARGQTTHPFYWAAFVAAGDWR